MVCAAGRRPTAVGRRPRIHTLPQAGPVQLVFGSCRVARPHCPPYTLSPDEDADGVGVDALYALALRMREEDPERWPDMLLMLCDQVYGDEVSPETAQYLRGRRPSAWVRGPGCKVAAGSSDRRVSGSAEFARWRHPRRPGQGPVAGRQPGIARARCSLPPPSHRCGTSSFGAARIGRRTGDRGSRVTRRAEVRRNRRRRRRAPVPSPRRRVGARPSRGRTAQCRAARRAAAPWPPRPRLR